MSCVDIDDAINSFMDTVYTQALDQIVVSKEFQTPSTPPTRKHINNRSRPESIDVLYPQKC